MDTEMRELLAPIAIEGEPATLAHLRAIVDMPVERLEQLLKLRRAPPSSVDWVGQSTARVLGSNEPRRAECC